MAKKKNRAVASNRCYPQFAHLIKNMPVNTFGVVEKVSKTNSDLLIGLKDECSRISMLVKTPVRDSLFSLKIGDIMRIDGAQMGLLDGDQVIIFNERPRKTSCIVWSNTCSYSTPKIMTDENAAISPDHENRITLLREMFAEISPGGNASQDSRLSEEIDEHRHRIMINQASGLNPPPLPESLTNFKEHFSSLAVKSSSTTRFINEIQKSTNGCSDNYFNLFTQVVSIHRTSNLFVLRVWDGTTPIGLEELLGGTSEAIEEDVLEMDVSIEKAIAPFLLNIVCYGNCWESDIRKMKRFDIILLANLHITRRSLGELSLSMHEGQQHRRCLAILPHDHVKAIEIAGRCEAKLKSLKPETPVPDEHLVKEDGASKDGDLSNLLMLAQGANDTIRTWHPSVSQGLSQIADKSDYQEQLMDVDEQAPTTSASGMEISSEPVTGASNEKQIHAEMEIEDVNVEAPQCGNVLALSFSKQLFSSLFRAYMKKNLADSGLSWRKETDLAFSLPHSSVLNFQNFLNVDVDRWKQLTDYKHLFLWTIKCPLCSAESKVQAASGSWCPICFDRCGYLSQCELSLSVLIPLQTDVERLLLASFPQKLMIGLFPHLESLADARVVEQFAQLDNAEWIREVKEELQQSEVIGLLNSFICSVIIERRQNDVCILNVKEAIPFAR